MIGFGTAIDFKHLNAQLVESPRTFWITWKPCRQHGYCFALGFSASLHPLLLKQGDSANGFDLGSLAPEGRPEVSPGWSAAEPWEYLKLAAQAP